MKGTGNNCLNLGLLLPVGILSSRETLLRIIRGEECNASVYKTLSQIFQDIDSLMTTIFSKMAAEERRHTTVLKWCYRKRFGSEAPVVQPEKFDSKTLSQALHAGLCRLLREKVAEKRRENRFTAKWVAGLVLGFMRWVRRGLQWRSCRKDSIR